MPRPSALETVYPDGERDRVEFNQSGNLGIADSDPVQSVPAGMATKNQFLITRNTYYWGKQACAYAYGDYSKAKIYHWLHTTNLDVASGILESVKDPLEGRVWFNYADQSDPSNPSNDSIIVGSSNKPAHIGRVLDDGSTQLYTYEYNGFGNLTKTIDPVGRTFSFIYAENDIDLLETRQTRAGQKELLSQTTYNAQHLPLTSKDAAGQTTTYTYNARGQLSTITNALGDTTTYHYDDNGYRTSVVGPLGDTTKWTYDAFGRIRTRTEENKYTLPFDYDALDRLTKITFPDSTVDKSTYTLLDRTLIHDRAGRQTLFEYNSVRQMTKLTDPLNRISNFQWCKCGALKTLTDPMGRTTTWRHDIQGRVKCKEYPDGSKITYLYENNTSRLRQRIDEKLQVTQYNYNRDDTLSDKSYTNVALATPSVALAYDPNYSRVTSMTDGTGTMLYSYTPITPIPTLGAGQLASVDGPLPNDTITYGYDALGRRVSTAINQVASIQTFDAIGRIKSVTNELGIFKYTYDGLSRRKASQSYPNGQTSEYQYGNVLEDKLLQRVTHKSGTTPISELIYGHELSTGQITTWSQQIGTQTPAVYSLGYDDMDQLTSAIVSEGTSVIRTFIYSYDPAGNRLTEQIDATTTRFIYNALNQLTSSESPDGEATTCEWDAEQRLTSITSGNKKTRFTYDGLGRCVAIRRLVDGSEVSDRRFVWCDSEICEERTPNGAVSKRFFWQGMQLVDGPATGIFFYTQDHLGSIRELIDSAGTVRARYAYDPFGRATRVEGDLNSDFGFAGMFRSEEANLNLTWRRPYDSAQGRWLSRDPLEDTELERGSNLYTYVQNNPVSLIDPLGLCCEAETDNVVLEFGLYRACIHEYSETKDPAEQAKLRPICMQLQEDIILAVSELAKCRNKPCKPECKPPHPPPKPKPKPK